MKKAVSLIELLLAIVIVGIGVAALPYISVSSAKGNAQTVLSEVVASSRIYIDDILLQSWNSALSTGFIAEDKSGAKVYSGILKTAADDSRFVSADGKITDAREAAKKSTDTSANPAGTSTADPADPSTDPTDPADTAKSFLFNRTIAKTKDDKIVAADALNDAECADGLNCAQKPSKIETSGEKNAIAFNISSKVNFISIEEKPEDKKIIATFNPSSVATDTTNAIMVEVKATAPIDEKTNAPAGNLLDDVNNITLRSFSFNIGSEPQ